jgi:hypothetical protein
VSIPVTAPTLSIPFYVCRGKLKGRCGLVRHVASYGPIVEWLDGSRNIIGWGSVREFKVGGRTVGLEVS